MAENPHTIAFAHSWSKKMTVEEKRELESLIKELQRDGRSLRVRPIDGVPVRRVPLSLDRIDELWEALEYRAPVYLVRAVEQEHGIGVPASDSQTKGKDTS